MPSITALVFEYSAPQRRNVNTAVAFAGIGIGGAAMPVVAATVVPAFGFRSEFLVGDLAALVILRWPWPSCPSPSLTCVPPGASPTPGGGPRDSASTLSPDRSQNRRAPRWPDGLPPCSPLDAH